MPGPEAAVRAAPVRTAPGRSAATYVLALVIAGSGFLQPSFADGATLGDLAVVGLTVMVGVDIVVGRRRAAVGYVRSLAPGAYLVALGSLLGAMTVGLAGWVVDSLVRDVAVGLTFLVALETLERDRRSVGLLRTVLVVTGAVVAVQLLVLPHDELRAQATFPNPNVAAHFLATVLVATWVLGGPRVLRVPVTGLLIVGLVVTSSFGALAQVAAAAAYLGFIGLRRVTSGRPRVFIGLLAATLVTMVLGFAFVTTALPDTTDTSALSEERLEKSGSGRLALWRQGVDIAFDYPLGAGPSSTDGLDLLDGEKELHNEPLAYLAERGFIGLAGFVAVAVALWRIAPAGAGARALLVGFGVQSLFRETSHYRHLWLALALAVVADRTARSRPVRSS